jgi:pyruvate kinase
MRFEQSDIIVKVEKTDDDFAHCVVVKGGTLIQYDRVVFDDHVLDIPFMVEKDKKDILRGLEHGIHMVAASGVKEK